jgi:uncharacterized protein YdcH (DUF465 family)
MVNEDALKEEMIKTDPEFRRLYEQHQECERRLEELLGSSVMSEADELEAKQLKRQKLFFKDQMAAILQGAEEAKVTA